MSYDAKTIWQHCCLEFKHTIHGQSPEIIQHYIDQCCGSLLSQGILWSTVTQLRSYMVDYAQEPLQPKKLHFEKKIVTPAWSQTILETQRSQPAEKEMRIPEHKVVNNQIVQFRASDWDRTKIQIELYNRQIRKKW